MILGRVQLCRMLLASFTLFGRIESTIVIQVFQPEHENHQLGPTKSLSLDSWAVPCFLALACKSTEFSVAVSQHEGQMCDRKIICPPTAQGTSSLELHQTQSVVKDLQGAKARENIPSDTQRSSPNNNKNAREHQAINCFGHNLISLVISHVLLTIF